MAAVRLYASADSTCCLICGAAALAQTLRRDAVGAQLRGTRLCTAAVRMGNTHGSEALLIAVLCPACA